MGRAGGGGLWVVGERAVVSDEETSREREQERIAVLRGTGTIVYVLYCIDEVSNIHMRRGWSRWRDCVSARNRHCSSWRDFIPSCAQRVSYSIGYLGPSHSHSNFLAMFARDQGRQFASDINSVNLVGFEGYNPINQHVGRSGTTIHTPPPFCFCSSS